MKAASGIIFFLLLSCLAGCQPDTSRKEGSSNQEAVAVRVERVRLQDIQEALEYVGSIKAEDEAVVYPKVSGKLMQKLKEEGSPVEKAEAIAYIDRDEVGLKFEKAPVESPLAGVIGRMYVDIGAEVSPSTAVALVVNMDKVKISLDIPEKYLPKIQLGATAKIKVDAYGQEEFSGQITQISPVVNLENRAAPVKITVENPQHRLKSGMFCRVNLVIAQHKNTPVIFKEAILGQTPDNFVYLVKDNLALRREISLGMSEGPFYEVTAGLQAGDLVVVMGQQRLSDKAAVSVEFANSNTEKDNL